MTDAQHAKPVRFQVSATLEFEASVSKGQRTLVEAMRLIEGELAHD